ncbi:Spc19-domain-containing protein [Parasitella parasitica]|nr:Spc19-domain-containing protein [Parasitella parasitica]
MATAKSRPAGFSFQEPFSLIENLESSVKSLNNVNQTLKSTIESLNQETREFGRQSQLTTYNRHYEIVTESDIRHAQHEFSKELRPELDFLLEEAELLLNALASEEKRLTINLEKQEKSIRDSQLAANKTRKKTTSRQAEKKVKEPFPHRSIQKLKQLQDRQNRLIHLHELEDESLAQETKELVDLQNINLATEKQMETADLASVQNALDGEKNENELKQEIENLEKLTLIKKQFLDQHENQHVQQTKPVEAIHEEEAHQLSPAESISLYTSHLGLIQNVLDEINQPNFVASVTAVANCETQSKRYYQALQNEIATQPYTQRNQSKWISLLGRLCQVVMQDGMIGKTAGRVLELLLSSADTRIPISTLQEVNNVVCLTVPAYNVILLLGIPIH